MVDQVSGEHDIGKKAATSIRNRKQIDPIHGRFAEDIQSADASVCPCEKQIIDAAFSGHVLQNIIQNSIYIVVMIQFTLYIYSL